MNASELVDRLRKGPISEYYGENTAIRDANLRNSAADLIEAQSKALEEMREALEHARHSMWEHGFSEDELQPIRQALASHSKEGEQV